MDGLKGVEGVDEKGDFKSRDGFGGGWASEYAPIATLAYFLA